VQILYFGQAVLVIIPRKREREDNSTVLSGMAMERVS
jgi:hypothetical protein